MAKFKCLFPFVISFELVGVKYESPATEFFVCTESINRLSVP